MQVLDYVHIVDFPSKENLLRIIKNNRYMEREKREIPVFSLKLFDDVRHLGLEFDGCIPVPLEITGVSNGKRFFSLIRSDRFSHDLTVNKNGRTLLISKNRAPWLRRGMPVEIRYADSGMVFLSLKN